MKIKIPHSLYRYGKKYLLYMEYAPDTDCHCWRVSYVGDFGILFSAKDPDLRNIEDQVFDFIKTNTIDYD